MTAPQPRRLGESLLSLGHISAEILTEALRKQSDVPGAKIGRVLIELGVPEQTVTEALARQADLEWVNLADRVIPPDIGLKIPPEYARKFRVIPFELRGDLLRVAITDPHDTEKLTLISQFLNMPVQAVMVSDSDMEIVLDRIYGKRGDGQSVLYERRKTGKPEPVPIVGGLGAEKGGEPSPEDPAAVRVLDELLLRAVRDGVSDIHIAPFERSLRVRLRIDGVIHEIGVGAVAPKAIAARIKVLASLDPAETRRPQDGSIRVIVENRSLDLRISTVATNFGEKVVMRILDRERIELRLDALGMEGDILSDFRASIRKPHGLILVTGPTGSGKTTTLYAALAERNTSGLNVTTIEDPIEYSLYGVNQIQVHTKIGVTFAAGLRHVLRQDPDIILVGEIRDRETAEVAIQAAMTGHLVLTTLHTNDAVGAVARLLDMGVEPFLLADALVAVLSQRLVRRLCPKCRTHSAVSGEEVGLTAQMPGLKPGTQLYRAAGCPACLGTGYKGRMGIYELFRVTPSAGELIRTKTSSQNMLAAAVSDGHKRLKEDGVTKILAGHTTLDEVMRVS
jgi:type IV pilus assembly protein PilB